MAACFDRYLKKIKHYREDDTIRSALISLCIKPISLVLSLLYTPLLLKYLGDEQYGVWATMLSIISWINYCDIGIGNGLRNILTKELTHRQYKNAESAISTAYICLSALMGIILSLLIAATFFIDWKSFFNTQYEVRIPLLISFVFISVNFVLALCNIILLSLQKSEITSIKSVCVQIINIIGVILLDRFTSGSLIYMSILFGASSFLVHATASFAIAQKRPYLAPKCSAFDRSYVKAITSLGVKFFVAQIAALILYTTDNLLVSRLYGASCVTPFSIADKVFNTGYMVFAAVTVPFWSKTTQEIEKQNYTIIRRYFKQLNVLALLFAAACICVSIVFRPVVNVWLRKELDFSNTLIAVMCIYYSIYAFCGVSSPFINGMNGVNGVMVLGIIQGVLNIPLSIFFAKNCGMGVVGIRLGTLIVVFAGAIFQLFYFNYLISKASIKPISAQQSKVERIIDNECNDCE